MTAEQTFLKLWNELYKHDQSTDRKIILTSENGCNCFELDYKNKVLWVHIGVWSVFDKHFGMTNTEIQKLIKTVANDHLGIEGLTPFIKFFTREQALKHLSVIQ